MEKVRIGLLFQLSATLCSMANETLHCSRGYLFLRQRACKINSRKIMTKAQLDF